MPMGESICTWTFVQVRSWTATELSCSAFLPGYRVADVTAHHSGQPPVAFHMNWVSARMWHVGSQKVALHEFAHAGT